MNIDEKLKLLSEVEQYRNELEAESNGCFYLSSDIGAYLHDELGEIIHSLKKEIVKDQILDKLDPVVQFYMS